MSTASRLLLNNTHNSGRKILSIKPVSCFGYVVNGNNRYHWKNSKQQFTTMSINTKNTISSATIMPSSSSSTSTTYEPAVLQSNNNNNNCCYNDNDSIMTTTKMNITNNNSNDNNNVTRRGAIRATEEIIHQPSVIGGARTVGTECAIVNGVDKFSSSFLLSNSLNCMKNHINYSSKICVGGINNRKMSTYKPIVQVSNINPNIVLMEYAVRGPLVIRAGEIEKELKSGKKKPFNEVIRANIGDCHAMGQKPITFLRQVMALTIQPSLLESPDYPSDVKERAKIILNGCQGFSLGSYSDSAGIEVIRRQAAKYIEERDGYPADWSNIILTAGASQGIKGLLSLLRCEINGKKPGIMVPIPQYPLYSATIAEFGMQQVGYYLDEANKWGLSIAELERSINDNKEKACPRAIVVINPGNPTGQVLTYENIQEIIKFAHREKLVIFADEVYQDNIYDKNSKFHSFKKVLMEMGEPYNKMELASFMSCSKGYMGECGLRGGYMEIINFDPDVKAMFLKSISAQLCPTTSGQAAISCVVNPPKPGEPSYDQFIKEKTNVLQSLKERAELVYKTFNSFEGFSCNPVQGAMYAFPQFKIPPKAIEAAKKAGKAPDVFYAFELLENTGVCIVPGTGFGQLPGTHHFRTTILPQTDKLKLMLDKFQKFHMDFMAKYK